jgi:plastocyanin
MGLAAFPLAPGAMNSVHTFQAALVLAALCAATAVHAGALTIDVVDAAGKPLVDAVALLEPASGKVAVKPMADVELAQSRRQFQPRVTVITVGTRVAFPNFDTVRHHVYSFSPIKTFELKLYAGTPNVPVVFDKPGVAVLGCNIHDNMAAWVVVADTPWFARSTANGKARIDAVPPGRYRLRVWHPGLPANAEPTPMAITVDASDAEQHTQLAVSDAP